MRTITKHERAKLDLFAQHYVACALWSSTDGDGEPLDRFNTDDISDETINRMVEDCERFERENANDLATCTRNRWTQGGHDFWLTRNGHGAGFWDSYKGDPWPDDEAKRLTKAAEAFGEFNLYVGDDGRIYH